MSHITWRKEEVLLLSKTQCLKIKEKVAFKIASEASYNYILREQKFITNGQFWRVYENLNYETFLVIFKHCGSLQSLITLAFKESLLMMSFAMNFPPILELNSHYIFKVYRIFGAICQVKISRNFIVVKKNCVMNCSSFRCLLSFPIFFSTKKETSM